MRRAGDENTRLRWWDPRFAAGVPWPERIAVDHPDTIDAARGTIPGEVVALDRAGMSTCDLVVLTRAGAGDLDLAWRALRADGGCWIEARSWPGGVPRLLRSLERPGFSDLGLFAAWPSRVRTRYWLPLHADRPGSLAWSLPRHEGRGPVKRLLHHVRVALWRLRLKLRLGVSIAVVARRPADRAAGEPSGAAQERRATLNVRRTIDALVVGGHGGNRRFRPTWWCLATGGRHSSNKVVALIADEPFAAARVVAKLPRVEASGQGLDREARMLALLERRGVSGVPRLLGRRELAGGVAIVESALAGRPLQSVLRARRYPQLAALGRRWLIGLPQSTDGATRTVRAVIDGFEPLARPHVEAPFLRRGIADMRRLDALPGMVEHRDFGPWNLLIDGAGRLQVLDWESSVPDGVPGADLVYFLTYLRFYVLGATGAREQLRAYRGIWSRASPDDATPVACAELACYLENLKADPRLAHAIRLYAWALHAVSEQDRQRSATAAPGPPGIFLRLWRAESALRTEGDPAPDPPMR